MKVIAFHSSKGGTGKTFLVANMGQVLASLKKKCIILDCDVSGPSFNTIFKSKKPLKFYINDVLLGKCSIRDAVQQTEIENLDLVFANPEPILGEGILSFYHPTHVNALRYLSNARTDLHELGYDLVLLDTMPGLNPLSINTLLVAQTVVLVVRPDAYGLKTTNHILQTVYTKLQDSAIGAKQYFLIFNQVPHASVKEIAALLAHYEEEMKKNFEIEVLGHISCLCEKVGAELIHTPLLKKGDPGMDVITTMTQNLLS